MYLITSSEKKDKDMHSVFFFIIIIDNIIFECSEKVVAAQQPSSYFITVSWTMAVCVLRFSDDLFLFHFIFFFYLSGINSFLRLLFPFTHCFFFSLTLWNILQYHWPQNRKLEVQTRITFVATDLNCFSYMITGMYHFSSCLLFIQ